MLHVSIYCQLAWYLNTVSIFGKLRVWNLTTVGTSSCTLLGLMCSWCYICPSVCGGLDNVAIGLSVDVDDLEGYRLVLYNTNNHVT